MVNKEIAMSLPYINKLLVEIISSFWKWLRLKTDEIL